MIMNKNVDLVKTQAVEDGSFRIEEYRLSFMVGNQKYNDLFCRVYINDVFSNYLYRGMELDTLEEVSNEIYKRC